MGLYGMMRTSASGMAAQANRLSTVADNIANSSTTGYKRASAEFSSLILKSGGSEYISGSVETRVRYAISEQGTFKFTTSVTDLAINGNGFFIVANDDGQTFLTRAGSFVQDGDGNLVNAAGFKLMGYSLANGAPPPVANGTAGLAVVNIGALALQATRRRKATFRQPAVQRAAIVAGDNLPSANAAGATYTAQDLAVTYDNLGNEVTLDVYYDQDRAPTPGRSRSTTRPTRRRRGGFPYSPGRARRPRR